MAELFSGQYYHSIDSKGRLIIPAKFRDILGSQFKIGVSLDPCLYLYSNEGFAAFYEKLQAIPANKAGARKLIRYFMSGTFDVELDKQGRILVPQQLRKNGMNGDVVFLGNGSHAELWTAADYEKEMGTDSREEISKIADDLFAEGFMI